MTPQQISDRIIDAFSDDEDFAVSDAFDALLMTAAALIISNAGDPLPVARGFCSELLEMVSDGRSTLQ